MKLTIKPDGTREAEGTPAELREFDGAQVPLHVGPPLLLRFVPYSPPCTCGQTTGCAAHPFGHGLTVNAGAAWFNNAAAAPAYGGAGIIDSTFVGKPRFAALQAPDSPIAMAQS